MHELKKGKKEEEIEKLDFGVRTLKIQCEINERSWNKWQNKLVISEAARGACSHITSTIVVETKLAGAFFIAQYWKKELSLNNKLWKHWKWFLLLSALLQPNSPHSAKDMENFSDSNVGQFKLLLWRVTHTPRRKKGIQLILWRSTLMMLIKSFVFFTNWLFH